MKTQSFLFALFFSGSIAAQNVGIGTTTPTAKLEVKNPGFSNIKLSSDGPLDTTRLTFANSNGSIGSEMSVSYLQELGLAVSSYDPLFPYLSSDSLVFIQRLGNVGVNTRLPVEKLDINGNINVRGTIKVNGTDGTAGQVLMKNSSGDLTWGDWSNYKNTVTYNQSGSWTVPAGVTKIVIEAWGAGGGGASGGGGAGGAYIRTSEITVSPGGSVTVTIGTGGAAAASEFVNASDGGNTTASGSFGSYLALGGYGATTSFGGTSNGIFITGSPFIQCPGKPGSGNTVTYAERTAGQFVEITQYGSGGGVAPYYVNNSMPGSQRVIDIGTSAVVKTWTGTPSSNTIGHGGGGGGAFAASNWGRSGGNGMMIIHY